MLKAESTVVYLNFLSTILHRAVNRTVVHPVGDGSSLLGTFISS